MKNCYVMHLKIIWTVPHKKRDTKLMPVTSSNPVFELPGSQSLPAPSLLLTALSLYKNREFMVLITGNDECKRLAYC